MHKNYTNLSHYCYKLHTWQTVVVLLIFNTVDIVRACLTLTFQTKFDRTGLAPHGVTILSVHCGIAALASCLVQWGQDRQTDFTITVKNNRKFVLLCVMRETKYLMYDQIIWVLSNLLS